MVINKLFKGKLLYIKSYHIISLYSLVNNMGRYANFNTGFEYKFAFGIQSSKDITEFGGMVNDTDDEEYNSYYSGHVWKDDDNSKILSILKYFGEGFVLPDFSEYENTMEGTYDLYQNLMEEIPKHNVTDDRVKEFFKFSLGCLIYHQLLYEENLTVQYEL